MRWRQRAGDGLLSEAALERVGATRRARRGAVTPANGALERTAGWRRNAGVQPNGRRPPLGKGWPRGLMCRPRPKRRRSTRRWRARKRSTRGGHAERRRNACPTRPLAVRLGGHCRRAAALAWGAALPPELGVAGARTPAQPAVVVLQQRNDAHCTGSERTACPRRANDVTRRR